MTIPSTTADLSPAPPDSPGRLARFPIIQPLRQPAFRSFLLAMMFFTAGMQIQQVGQGWLVFHLTGSSVALGVVTAMWSIPILLVSPIGGVLADRLDRRRTLMVTWGLTGLVFALVTALLLMDRLEVWHLAVASLATGVLFALNIPARSALISQLAPEVMLGSAMAITSLAFNLNGIIFPLVGGGLIDLIGPGGAYVLVTLFYFGAMGGMVLVPSQPAVAQSGRSPLQDMAAGFKVVKGHAGLRWLLVVGLLAIVVNQPYQGLLPQIASQTLNVPASGLGLLLTLVGVGAFLGNLILANLGPRADLVRWMLGLGLVSGFALIGLALAQNLMFALIALFLVGLTAMPFGTLNNTLVQRMAPPEVRGRVLSIYILTWGAIPVGNLAAAALADTMGPAMPLAIGGFAMIAVAMGAWHFRPAEAKAAATAALAATPAPTKVV